MILPELLILQEHGIEKEKVKENKWRKYYEEDGKVGLHADGIKL